jgi:D-lactate dehydrogenase
VAESYAGVERLARAGVRLAGGAGRLAGRHIPAAAPPGLPFTVREGAAAVYLPACINRIFARGRGEPAHPTLPEALVALSARAGRPLWIPPDAAGHCCGTPWSSKGYTAGHQAMSTRLARAVARWSENGALPVVIDATSCTHGVRSEAGVEGIRVLDSIEWVHDELLARLGPVRRLSRVAVHPTCSCGHLGLAGKLAAIAGALADEVVVPAGTTCCGMAGDRGWLHPELPASALREVSAELEEERFDAYLSSNRTCEAALRQVTGHPYASFVLSLEEATRG